MKVDWAHHKSLAPLLERTCREFGVSYSKRGGLRAALIAHYGHLSDTNGDWEHCSAVEKRRSAERDAKTREQDRGSENTTAAAAAAAAAAGAAGAGAAGTRTGKVYSGGSRGRNGSSNTGSRNRKSGSDGGSKKKQQHQQHQQHQHPKEEERHRRELEWQERAPMEWRRREAQAAALSGDGSRTLALGGLALLGQLDDFHYQSICFSQ